MKIRMGFVSNSSTSSFCIYGVMVEKINTKLLFQKLKEVKKSNAKAFDKFAKELETYIPSDSSDNGGETKFIRSGEGEDPEDPEKEIIKNFKNIDQLDKKQEQEVISYLDELFSDDIRDMAESFLLPLLNDSRYEVNEGSSYGDGGLYIGKHPNSIKDDETGKQFRDTIKEELSAFFGKVKCGLHEEAWRDG